MELAQGHMESHLLFAESLQAVQGQGGTFTDADACGAYEAESMGFQSVGEAELLLQTLVFFQRKGFG